MANTASEKTKELINLLKQLATTSKVVSNNLDSLTKEASKLANIKFSTNIQKSMAQGSEGLKKFIQLLKDAGIRGSELAKVERAIKSIQDVSVKENASTWLSKKRSENESQEQNLKAQLTAQRAYRKREEERIYGFWGRYSSTGKGRDVFKGGEEGVIKRAALVADPKLGVKLLQDYRNLQTILRDITTLQEKIAENALKRGEQRKFAEPYTQGKGVGQEISAGKDVVDEKFIRSLNLSEKAAQNFKNRLAELGMTAPTVRDSFTDMNTGLQHIKLEATNAEGGIQKLNATVDRAGNVIASTQNRYRTFASAIARDVVEVVKWSIAIGAVYGPMRKLQELMEEAKAIQSDLVDVQISLGESTANLQGIFESSVDIANETSSAVQGVIEGYVAAVAAAGSVAGESQRLATTQLLVRDSMVFAKLAGVEQKEALDTLVGALRQADLELTDGMQLLDSWVAVSRNANVSINQLASTFAIVGAGAEDVGLSYSQLNALAATMAETTKLSADEVGNAIRGIIATLQTDKASAEFAKYGIATKTASGELRNMMDILRELNVLQQQGILDPKAMGALTQAGGGGARRGAQLSALVSNMSRVMEIVTVSENASGDATDALQLKMNTLESTVQRLNNAFSGLAQSLGMEGGLVGAMTTVAEVATTIVNGFKEVVSTLKGAAPLIAALGVGKLFMGTATAQSMLAQKLPVGLAKLLTPTLATQQAPGGERLTNIPVGREAVGGFAPLTNALISALQRSGLGYTKTMDSAGMVTYQQQTIGGLFERLTSFLQKDISRGLKVGSFLVPGMLMASNIGQENGVERLGAQAVGTGLGAALASMTGAPEWVTIGATIATGFYDKFLTFEEDIVKEWMVAREQAQTEPETPEKARERLQEKVLASMSWGETARVSMRQFISNAAVSMAGTWRELGVEKSRLPLAGLPNITKSQALLGTYFKGRLDEETSALVEELLASFEVAAAEAGLKETETEKFRALNIENVAELAAQASEDLMTKALEELRTGAEGAVGRYTEAKQAADQYQTAAGTFLAAQEKVPGMTALSPRDVMDLITQLDAQQRELLSTYAEQIISSYSGIEVIQEQIKNTPNASQEQIKTWTEEMNEYREAIRDATDAFPALVQGLQRTVLVQSAEEKLMPIINVPEGMTSEQRANVIAGAEKLWREYLELSKLSPDEINAYVESQRDQLIRANDEIFSTTTKVPQEYISSMAEQMGLSMGGASQFGFMDLRKDFTTESFQSQLIPRYLQVLGAFQRNFAQFGWKPEEEKTGFILENGFTTMDIDLRLLQLAMQDLIDINREKGLEGIYNLPEGATFAIPMTGFQMDRNTRFGMETAGGGSLFPQDIFSEELPGVMGTGITTGTGITDREEQLNIMTRDQLLDAVDSFRRAGELREERLVEEPTVPPWFQPAYSAKEYNEFLPSTQMPQKPEGTTDEQGAVQSTLRAAGDAISNAIISSLSPFFKSLRKSEINFSEAIMPSKPSETSELQRQNAPAPIALNLSMDSTTQLTVDGRTLATIIKPYLYEDLLRYSASTPVVNRSVI